MSPLIAVTLAAALAGAQAQPSPSTGRIAGGVVDQKVVFGSGSPIVSVTQSADGTRTEYHHDRSSVTRVTVADANVTDVRIVVGRPQQ